MLKNSTTHYGLIAQLFHWLSAIMVIALFNLGLWMLGLNYTDKWYTLGPYLHVSFGAVLVIILVLRLLWRWLNLTPAADTSINAIEKHAAHIAHIIIYLLLFIIIISGYLMETSESGRLDVFDWFSIGGFVDLPGRQLDLVGKIHLWCSYALMALVAVHVLAALKHHFINKDSTLTKMIFFLKTRK